MEVGDIFSYLILTAWDLNFYHGFYNALDIYSPKIRH